MKIEVNVGDEVIIYIDNLTKAVVTDTWPSKYSEGGVGVVEVEYDNIFLFGKTRKIVDADHIRSVKPRDKKG